MSGPVEAGAPELWTGNLLPDAIYHQSVATIQSLQRRLSHQRRFGRAESEFLRLAKWVEKADPLAVRRVLESPSAYQWIRIADDFTACLLDRSTPSKRLLAHCRSECGEGDGTLDFSFAFAQHLRSFGLFAVSIAYHSEQSLSLDGTPLRMPGVLPATRWSFSNEFGSVELLGIKDGQELQFAVAGEPYSVKLLQKGARNLGPLTVHCAAELSVEGHSLTLQPHEFNASDLGVVRLVLACSPESQHGLRDEIESTLACLKSYMPRAHQQFLRTMRVIAFKAPENGGDLACMDPELLGAAVFTEGRHPLVLAEDFVRMEARCRFEMLRQSGSPVASELGGPTHYSPWRDRQCTSIELLGDALANERALSFWLQVLESGELAGVEWEYAAYRVATVLRQLEMALATLESSLTSEGHGETLRDMLRIALKEHLAESESFGISGDTEVLLPAAEGYFAHHIDRVGNAVTVDQMIQEHCARYADQRVTQPTRRVAAA